MRRPWNCWIGGGGGGVASTSSILGGGGGSSGGGINSNGNGGGGGGISAAPATPTDIATVPPVLTALALRFDICNFLRTTSHPDAKDNFFNGGGGSTENLCDLDRSSAALLLSGGTNLG